jgi:hypothetical protein
LVLRHTFQIGFAASDMCVSLDSIYVLGYKNNSIVHVFDLGGAMIQSFGDSPPDEHPLLRITLSDGLIACHKTGSVVAVFFRHLPLINVYDQGSLLFTRRLPDYRPVDIRTEPDGTVLWAYPEGGGYDQGASLWFSDNSIWAQTGYVVPSSTEYTEIVTYSMLMEDVGLSIRRDLPWLRMVMEESALLQREWPPDRAYPASKRSRLARQVCSRMAGSPRAARLSWSMPQRTPVA